MAVWLALDTPRSDPRDEQPGSPVQLWGEAFSGSGGSWPFLGRLPLPGAELTGGPGLGGLTSAVLPFLGAGPETRGRVSGSHRAAISNSFGI